MTFMQTEQPWCFVVTPRHFSRLIEGQIRHYITDLAVVEGDHIVFHQSGTARKAVFVSTHVDTLDDGHGGNYRVASIRLQEWASPDTDV